MTRSRGKQLLRKIGLTGCMMLLGVLSPRLGTAEVQKVDVCHREGNGSFHLVTVAAPAVQAHDAHGDALPGELVPNRAGFNFADTCEEVEVSTCPCDFSIGGLAAVGIAPLVTALGQLHNIDGYGHIVAG